MICKQLENCIHDTNKACKREKQCIAFTDDRSIVKCEERRKKYNLENDVDGARVRKYVMDEGIVKDEAGFKPCDNLLAVYGEGIPKLIFVELKGHDYKQAVKQLYETIKYFMPEVKKHQIYARLVHTQGIPRIGNSGIQVELECAVRIRGGNLKTQEWNLPEKLSEIDLKK